MRESKSARAAILLLIVAGILLWAPAADAVLIVVNTTEDLASGASCASGSTTCTLREAIRTANEDESALFDEIILIPGRYELTIPGTGEDFGAEGDLDVLGNLKIRGVDPETTIIDAKGIDRVFEVWDSYLLLDAMTITGGVAPDPDPGGVGGGGIRASGTDLELKEVHVIGNRATTGGGLLAWSPKFGNDFETVVVIRDSYFQGNVVFAGSTNSFGSAIYSDYIDSLTITSSTVSDNRCTSDVAICSAAVDISNCVAGDAVQVENSTVARNQGHGFVTHNCDTTIRHSTIAENGVYGLDFSSFDGADSLTMRSTIVANNGSSACFLPSGVHDVAGGKNLATDGSCGLNESLGDLPSTDPQLGPFGAFVSDAPSYHPEPGSPVIDVSGACAATGDDDQDGFERPDGDVTSGGSCDLGSIEVLPCHTSVDFQVTPGIYPSGTWIACHNLSASNVEVKAGSTVTARARYSISFGNGFLLGSGAALSAELDRTAGWIP